MKLYNNKLSLPTALVSLFTVIFVITGCEQSSSYQLNWQVSYNQKPLACTPSDKDTQLADAVSKPRLEWFLLLLHNVKVKVNDKWVSVKPIVKPNASDKVYLAGSACQADGSVIQHPLEFIAPEGFTELQFTIGVPFELNHQNPLQQQSPLNRPDMFWVWRNGHKFLRLEVVEGEKNLTYHLGSTGCSSTSSVRPPKSPCQNPNLMTINLIANDIKQNGLIKLDLNNLLTEDKEHNSYQLAGETHCLSSPDNADCARLFNKLKTSFSLNSLD